MGHLVACPSVAECIDKSIFTLDGVAGFILRWFTCAEDASQSLLPLSFSLPETCESPLPGHLRGISNAHDQRFCLIDRDSKTQSIEHACGRVDSSVDPY